MTGTGGGETRIGPDRATEETRGNGTGTGPEIRCYRTRERSRPNAYGGRDDVVTTEETYVDEESQLPHEFRIYYWAGLLPERRGELIGHADTLAAAWHLVRDQRHRARAIGWLWIEDCENDRAWFDLRESRRGLALNDRRSEFGSAD